MCVHAWINQQGSPDPKKEFNCHFAPLFLYYAPRVHSLHTTASLYCLISLYLHHLLWRSKKTDFLSFFSLVFFGRSSFSMFFTFQVSGLYIYFLLYLR